ncbi:MAG: mechanosensitive ion channel [Actinomycetia bacterium]|nr:mechanosensitive ion channel [Actinomycetes bacterium]
MFAVTTGRAVEDSLFVLGVILATLVFGRLVRVLVAAAIRRLASRSLLGAYSPWRVRVPRLVAESVPVAELRRQQRVTAAAAMLTRLLKIMLWLVAVVVVLERLDVDVIIAVSGAGFLGAAVAIGGQNSVHDYLNGVHVLLEDRFGEGDRIQLSLDTGVVVEGVVSRLGTFASRIETEEGTLHIANRRAFQVRNLSQQAHPRMFDVQVRRVFDDDASGQTALTAVVAGAVRDALGEADLGVVVDSVIVASVKRGRSILRTTARFGRSLSDDEIAVVSEAIGLAMEKRS